MKRLIAVILMVLAAGVCFGQQRLVVPPFQDRNSGIDASQIETLTDLFINAIQRTNRFEVPDRDSLALLTHEAQFQMSDWSNDAKTVEMGRILNANYIVRVIVSKIDVDVYLLIARLLDVNTAQILDSDELEFSSVRDARSHFDTFAQDCLNNIRTASETAEQQKKKEEQERRANFNPFLGKWRAVLKGNTTDCHMTFHQDGSLEITGLKTNCELALQYSSSILRTYITISNASAKGTYTFSSNSINLSLNITGEKRVKETSTSWDKRGKTSVKTIKDRSSPFSESVFIKNSMFSIVMDRLSLGRFLVNNFDKYLNSEDYTRFTNSTYSLVGYTWKNDNPNEYLNWVKVE
jgi:TolB-like protein